MTVAGPLTISLGVTNDEPEDDRLDDIIKRAECSLYRAKKRAATGSNSRV